MGNMDEDQMNSAKMSGYLQKKGKMRMMSIWKKYWFVLEGRLLLYYRSKDEYEAISPCKGSINLGPPCSVKSCHSVPLVFQLEYRTNVVTLRAETVEDQKRWMHSIMIALNQNQSIKIDSKLHHFRYSLDDLIPKNERESEIAKKYLERQHTLPESFEKNEKGNSEIIQRLRKIGAQSYGGSLDAICKANPMSKNERSLSQNSLTKKMTNNQCCNKQNILRRNSASAEHLYERIPCTSNKLKNFMVDNENYAALKQRNSSKIDDSDCVLIENDHYLTVDQEDEVFYNEPKVDYNKNSVMVDNSYYCPDTTENEYEELDAVKIQKTKAKRKLTFFRKDKKPEKLKKRESFIKKVWKRRCKSQGEVENDKIYSEVKEDTGDKLSIRDSDAIQMLSELQNILETKKTLLGKTLSNNSSTSVEPPAEEQQISKIEEDQPCPKVPPKERQSKTSQFCKSLDEVLDDLENNSGPKSKVQVLIEKFNDDDVTLRHHSQNCEGVTSHRHSDELSRLLEELAKVTNAPIMTPGVTSSLINPSITDEELLRLLPIRRRRLSEPDYDIPRPHRSVQSLSKNESDAISPTRFFGPVLPNDSPNSKEEESLCISIAPDSLEIEEHDKSPPPISFNSHDYEQCQNSHHFTNFNIQKFTNQIKLKNYNNIMRSDDDDIIYASPKPYISTHIIHACPNICKGNAENTVIYKNVKNHEVQDEIFKDSLEMCNESLTEF